jgi:hypothetical protein
VLQYLRGREELDTARVALWGDSLAAVNSADRNVAVPWDAEDLPEQSEPLGGVLALLGGLYEEPVRAVYMRGGLGGYLSLLDSPFCYAPHDCGLLNERSSKSGDLCDVAAALGPRPLRFEGLVDGLNRRLSEAALSSTYAPAHQAYRAGGAEARLELRSQVSSDLALADWLAKALAGP